MMFTNKRRRRSLTISSIVTIFSIQLGTASGTISVPPPSSDLASFFSITTPENNPNYNDFYVNWLNQRGMLYNHATFIASSSFSRKARKEEDQSVFTLKSQKNTKKKRKKNKKGVALHWAIDSIKSTIRLAVGARLEIRRDKGRRLGNRRGAVGGWVGFGLAEAGGMLGADCVMFTMPSSASGGAPVIMDAYVKDTYARPIRDLKQDWKLLNYEVSSVVPTPSRSGDEENEYYFIIFEAERKLDTNDSQDWPIRNDANVIVPSHRVIAAWGNDVSVDDETTMPLYHDDVARGTIRFHKYLDNDSVVGGDSKSDKKVYGDTNGYFDEGGSPESEIETIDGLDAMEVNYHHQTKYGGELESKVFSNIMKAESEGSIIITNPQKYITTKTTNYQWSCFNYDFLVSQGLPQDVSLHVIGVEPIIDESSNNNENFLHHMLLYGSTTNKIADTENKHKCMTIKGGRDTIFGWAPGRNAMFLPKEAGIPFGPGGGYVSLALQYHFSNPNKIENVMDNSGVKLYYTTKKRKHDIGVFQLGDPLILLRGEPVGEGRTKHKFTCPSSCTGENFVNEEVTVFSELFHMHSSGKVMRNQVLRMNNQTDSVVVHDSIINFWDYNQAGLYQIAQDSFQVQKGDAFRTSCSYEASLTTDNQRKKLFGYASDEEMCIAYLMYYPKQKSQNCGYKWPNPSCKSDYETKPLTQIDENVKFEDRWFGGNGGDGSLNSTIGEDSTSILEIGISPPIQEESSNNSTASEEKHGSPSHTKWFVECICFVILLFICVLRLYFS